MSLAVVILAAGSGTRMKSNKLKVLHKVAGKEMIRHVVDVANTLNPSRVIIIVPEKAQPIKDCLGDKVEYAVQKEQLGTAHALNQAAPLLSNFEGTVLVLYGDTPLIQSSSLKNMLDFHQEINVNTTVATAIMNDPFGYGRIIRNDSGIAAIVEEKDATDVEKEVTEANSGIYCFESAVLFEKLNRVKDDNEQAEYYLTDVISMLVNENALVEGFELDEEEIMGVNSRLELSVANSIMFERNAVKWFENGASVHDPFSTFIDSEVEIGVDSEILPFTFLKEKTVIGTGCVIGPFSQINDSTVGNNSEVNSSVLNKAIVGENCSVGPMSHLRPGTILKNNSKVGSYSEIKNSVIGENSKVPHLSYMGDAQIEENVNIGAGSITCNYDGRKKYKTHIKKGAFIGSDTMLVAPITIGENSFTGAGSVISHNVGDESLAIERNEQKNIKGYGKEKKEKK